MDSHGFKTPPASAVGSVKVDRAATIRLCAKSHATQPLNTHVEHTGG